MTKKLISYDDTKPGLGLPDVVEEKLHDAFARIDVSPTGTLAGDRAAVIAAAQAAKDAGLMEVMMAPGHYLLDEVNVDDIHGRYLVGSGVTFSPNSHVYPFRPGEMARRSVESPMEGGRGAIAFEVDDADPSHWQSLFPLTKELGTPFGLSWITDRPGTEWVKEAARHGWELMSHLPYDVDATALSPTELDQNAKKSVDSLEWATGTRDGHGIVYPRHVRSLETDRILSKYFARGRAGNARNARPMDAPNTWRYHAFDFDAHVTSGGLSDEIKDILCSVAASNSKMVFFTHWRAVGVTPERENTFRELVAYARNLGIAIKLPKQLMTRPQIIGDPYMETDVWTKTSTGGDFSTVRAYHGTRSVHTDTGITMQAPRAFIATKPGCFTVIRASVRIWTEGATVSSDTQGILFGVQGIHRDEFGEHRTGAALTFNNPLVPGPDIPAQEWGRHRRTFILPPGLDIIIPKWTVLNRTSGELWLDEMQIDVVDHIPELILEGNTNAQNATSNREIRHPAAYLDRLPYRLETIDTFEGTPSIEVGPISTNVKSTEPLDYGKRYRVIFSPTKDYVNHEWSAEGA